MQCNIENFIYSILYALLMIFGPKSSDGTFAQYSRDPFSQL